MSNDVAQRNFDQAGFRIANLGTPTTAGNATKAHNTTAPPGRVGNGLSWPKP